MAQVRLPKEFVEDYLLWEGRLRDEGETDESIAEIKQCIRDDWQDAEKRELWTASMKREADFMRELQAIGKGINDRIKPEERKAA